MTASLRRLLPLALGLGLFACTRSPAAPTAANDHDDHTMAPASNRIDVPPPVRENLGIEFAAVERRRVAATLRLPGHFELLPAARAEHRTPISGRVRILVQPLQPVAPGDPLYAIDSPEWRRLQRDLGELCTELQITEARIAVMGPLLEAHRAHEESLRDAAAVMGERMQSLEATRQSVGGQAQEIASTRVQIAQVRSQAAEAAEQHTETEARLAELRANLTAGKQRFDLALAAAATLTSTTPAALLAPVPGSAPAVPLWQQLAEIEVRATGKGLAVDLPVATGGWVETGALVVGVVDLGLVRFRAKCPQSHLPQLRPGQAAAVVPTLGSSLPPLPGALQLAAEADPAQRTLDVFLPVEKAPDWARPGVAAFLEFETRSGAEAELAIPSGAVLTDGLRRVFFRRDPADKDKVIRVEADLGVDDGRWIEVKSGLVDGDEIVLAGAYELMLASSGAAPKGGHFHADGTFHAEDHE